MGKGELSYSRAVVAAAAALARRKTELLDPGKKEEDEKMGLNCCERGRKKPNERAGRKERIKGGREGEQTFWAAVTSALRSERLAAAESARASPKKVHPFLILLRRRRRRGDTLPANITEGDSGGRAEKFPLFCLVRNPKRKERGADGKVGCQTKLLQDAMCTLLVPRLSLQSVHANSEQSTNLPPMSTGSLTSHFIPRSLLHPSAFLENSISSLSSPSLLPALPPSLPFRP